MKRKPKTAQQLCDDRRSRNPPSVFFIGDPPCPDCRREVAKRRKRKP